MVHIEESFHITYNDININNIMEGEGDVQPPPPHKGLVVKIAHIVKVKILNRIRNPELKQKSNQFSI